MTSDIVQRLRAVAGERYSEGANSGGTAGLLEDAATEIDRLRARLEELEGQEPLYVVTAIRHVNGPEVFVEIETQDGKSVRVPSENSGTGRRIGPLYTAPPATGRSEDVVKAVPEWLIESLRIIERSASESGDRLPQSIASTCLQSLHGDGEGS